MPVSTPPNQQPPEQDRPSVISIFFGVLFTLALFIAVFIPFLLAPMAVLALAYLVYYVNSRSSKKDSPAPTKPQPVVVEDDVVDPPKTVVIVKEEPVIVVDAPTVTSEPTYQFGGLARPDSRRRDQ